MVAVPSHLYHKPFFYYLLFSICMNPTFHFPHLCPSSLSLHLTAVLEHAAGIWWMITCHSLFIIIQTINYTSLMLVVLLKIYMLGTDQCENGISFAKCLSVGTAWWLQPGCFNSCVRLTVSSLTACHRSHCSKALFIVLRRRRLSEDKDVAKATVLKSGRQSRSQSKHMVPAPTTSIVSTGVNPRTLSTCFLFMDNCLILKGPGTDRQGTCCLCS